MTTPQINWSEWEEINPIEYSRLSPHEVFAILIGNGEYQYFKRKKPEVKLPIVFENDEFIIDVYQDAINIYSNSIKEDNCFKFSKNKYLPLLIQAVEAWKKLQENK